ncbi:hypothetical protein CKO25_11315 [Thiocapsa imhoffii]|uniref:Uncharacterized protein n=1 Tax=Thiocapsa imhoffii TaxID=382777 RepID=A0A9X0WJ39_9GAMM|nr:hypothetical protein [Thiocapsa imhoffii]
MGQRRLESIRDDGVQSAQLGHGVSAVQACGGAVNVCDDLADMPGFDSVFTSRADPLLTHA